MKRRGGKWQASKKNATTKGELKGKAASDYEAAKKAVEDGKYQIAIELLSNMVNMDYKYWNDDVSELFSLALSLALSMKVDAEESKTSKKTNAKSTIPTGFYTFRISGSGYLWVAVSIPPKAYKFWNNNKIDLDAYLRSDDRAKFLSNLGASPDADFYHSSEAHWHWAGERFEGPIFGRGKDTLEVEGSKPEETYSFSLEPKALKALGINVVKDEPWVSGPAAVGELTLKGSWWNEPEVELPTPFDPHKLEITYRKLAKEISGDFMISSIKYAGEIVPLSSDDVTKRYSFYLLPPKGVKKPGSVNPIFSE
jgi:hypothetical protein